MVANSLEEEIWQWKEEEVIGIIDKLVLDLKLVGISNQALDGSAETIEKVKETLSNVLSYIRVPGCVYAQMAYDWAPCVAKMYDISLNKWVSYSFADKQLLLTELELHMKTALENVNNPIAVLRAYVTKYGLGTFSPEEYESILQALPKESYAQTENAFKQNLKKKIEDLAYTKKVSSIVQLWRNVTGLSSIAEWTKTYNMPLVWAMPEHSKTFSTLLAVEGKERIDIERLDDAMTSLSQGDFTDVTDKVRLDKTFIMNVASEKYIDLLMPHVDELKAVISQSYSHPGMWQQNVVALRKITERFISINLRSEVSDKAKLKAAKLTEAQLRAALTKVLEGSAEACLMLLDEQ